MEKISAKDLDFAVYDIKYITLHRLSYKNVKIPRGFIFDGVTVPAPLTFLFSNKDLRQGIKAACFHDFMCQNKDKFSRKEATNILIELWLQAGLNKFKAKIAQYGVSVYQWLKGWK